MSTIRIIYYPKPDGSRNPPNFPATDQHPDAVRYNFDHPTFGALCVDAIGGAPSLGEVDAILAPSLDVRAGRAVDAVDRLQFEVMFDMENRMRAREGLGAITRVQYRNALINVWKTLNP